MQGTKRKWTGQNSQAVAGYLESKTVARILNAETVGPCGK